jgi:hypothetical protein
MGLDKNSKTPCGFCFVLCGPFPLPWYVALRFLFVLVLGDFGFGAVVSFNLQEHSPRPSLIRREDCPNCSAGV